MGHHTLTEEGGRAYLETSSSLRKEEGKEGRGKEGMKAREQEGRRDGWQEGRKARGQEQKSTIKSRTRVFRPLQVVVAAPRVVVEERVVVRGRPGVSGQDWWLVDGGGNDGPYLG